MASCRYCGADAGASGGPIAMCAACENAPLCDRCGHPRADHTHVFVRGVAVGCKRRVGDFQALASWRCECPGFRPVAGRLSEASFADAGEEQELPRLRIAPT